MLVPKCANNDNNNFSFFSHKFARWACGWLSFLTHHLLHSKAFALEKRNGSLSPPLCLVQRKYLSKFSIHLLYLNKIIGRTERTERKKKKTIGNLQNSDCRFDIPAQRWNVILRRKINRSVHMDRRPATTQKPIDSIFSERNLNWLWAF